MDEKNNSNLWFVLGAVLLISALAGISDYYGDAAITGDAARSMMGSGGYRQQSGLGYLTVPLKILGLVGIVVIIWLWVIKLYKEVFKKKHE